MNNFFLVCGLGSLGQQCAAALKEFGVTVSGISESLPTSWEVYGLENLLEQLLIGDCRQPSLLKKAGVEHCRTVLLVTSNEQVNIEAAFAVRLLNPQARLVVRSAQQNLNDLLSDSLGNFVAFEATQLSAPAFAIAALGSEVRGFIEIEGYLLRVVKTYLEPGHPWCHQRTLQEMNTHNRRLISHFRDGEPLPTEFHDWQAEQTIMPGDTLAYIEVSERTSEQKSGALQRSAVRSHRSLLNEMLQKLPSWQQLQQKLVNFWQVSEHHQTQRATLVVGLAVLLLLLVGTAILKMSFPKTGWWEAFYTVGIMMLGESDTVLGLLVALPDTVPLWLRLMNLGYMMAGTASIAVLYAVLTENLLAAKFQLPRKRPPVPLHNHVVIVGLGRVGRRIALFLQQIGQPSVGVSPEPIDLSVLPQLPVVVSDLQTALSKVNLQTARSIVIVTDDEMTNLELGLRAHTANGNLPIVIRVFNPNFSESIDRLLPYAKVLCAYSLAAEAFVAAAFGENVLTLIRLNEQTVMVTEYTIEAQDTLNGLLIAQIAYGYGVVPILYQKHHDPEVRLLPSDDIQLTVDDRLVVLATIEGLQRIERGELATPGLQLRVEKASNADAAFEGAMTIARISGCSIQVARQIMGQLPGILNTPLYYHQGQRLVRELARNRVTARLLPLPRVNPQRNL